MFSYLTAFDLYTMGQEGWKSNLLDSCTDLLEATLKVGKKELEKNISLNQYFGYVYEPSTVKHNLKSAIFVHDSKLDKRGPKSAFHRTHQLPFDKKLRKKKKFKNPKVLPRILGEITKNIRNNLGCSKMFLIHIWYKYLIFIFYLKKYRKKKYDIL